MKSFTLFFCASLFGLLVTGCNAPVATKVADPAKEHLRVSPVGQGTDIAPIPALKTNTAYLPKPKLSDAENLYSLSVIQAPIRDVLFKLARDAKLELNVLDEVSGQVTINLIDQPLSVIVDRLNEQANIRATLKGKSLTVQSDTAYWVNYPIDYVNLDRYSSSSILLANAVGPSSQATAAVTLGTPSNQPQPATSLQAGSNVAILNRTKNEVWKTLGDGVMRILRSHYPVLGQPVLEGQTPPAKTVTPTSATKEGTTTPQATTESGAGGLPLPSVLPLPEQSLAASNVPVGPYPEGESVSSYVSLAREAGFIGVYTTRRVHTEVQKYIDSLMGGTRKQVMIEATVVEVALNDENQAGINWGAITGGFSMTQNYVSSSPTPTSAGVTVLTSDGRVANDWSVSSKISLLQRFGNSQVLSSPKIVGVNNQPTLLKVVKNLVYFTTTVTPGTTTNGVTTPAVFSTTPNTVPVGLVMSVLPSIDQHDQITLVVRPTISNLVRYVEDPNPEFKKATLTTPVVSLVPEIQEREMESVLKLNDGQVAILGGLIQDETVGEDTGVPGLVTQSTLGYLFGQKNTQKRKTELVIFLRPTLVKHPDIEKGDFAPYRDFLQKNTSPQALQR
jgi:general secretion pathway protein D